MFKIYKVKLRIIHLFIFLKLIEFILLIPEKKNDIRERYKTRDQSVQIRNLNLICG